MDNKLTEEPNGEIEANLVPGADQPDLNYIHHPVDIVRFNDRAIRSDFKLLTNGRSTQKISDTNRITGSENLFVEEGAVIEHCIINASEGPVYIGKNALLMEGCMLRGPVAVCEGAVLKMGAQVYGATTIGPYSVAGGEIKNSVIFGFSNKAHHGYMGDSVIGEWCNWGAGTSNSNVKNTAGAVKVWDNATRSYIHAGNKCGLFMGDYSRCAINTSFNTGTVVGVCCNIFGNEQPPKLVPDFTWGDKKYTFEKIFADIANWKQFKGHSLTLEEKIILESLYNHQT